MGDKEDKQGECLAGLLLEVDKQRQLLHAVVDDFVDKVLCAARLCAGKEVGSGRKYNDMEAIVQMALAFLTQKCTEISGLKCPQLFQKTEAVEDIDIDDADDDAAHEEEKYENVTVQRFSVKKTPVRTRQKVMKLLRKNSLKHRHKLKEVKEESTAKFKVTSSRKLAKKSEEKFEKSNNEIPNERNCVALENEENSELKTEQISLSTEDDRNAAEKEKHRCDVCEKEFPTSARLSAHRRSHFYEPKYKCKECGRGYPFKSHFDIHMLTHTGEKPHKCELCGKAFQLHHQLSEHLKTHSGEKPSFHCEVCAKTFTRKFNLHKHQRIHLKDNPYRCHVCDHNFSTSSDLHRHIMLHTGERPFQCDICEEGFTRKRYLVRHKRKHTGERPFKCNTCGKCFICKSTLDVHMKTHRPETPYLCDHCGRGFKIQSSLHAHKRSHIDIRNEGHFKCSTCDKAFRTNYLLSVHKRTHREDKPFSCELCGKCFRERCQLIAHRETHSEERPFKCDMCDKSFKKDIQLSRHTETHRESTPFKCDVCGKAFKIRYSMLAHRRKMHVRKENILRCESKNNVDLNLNLPVRNSETGKYLTSDAVDRWSKHSSRDLQQDSGDQTCPHYPKSGNVLSISENISGRSEYEIAERQNKISETLLTQTGNEPVVERSYHHEQARKCSAPSPSHNQNSVKSTPEFSVMKTDFKIPFQMSYEPMTVLVESEGNVSQLVQHSQAETGNSGSTYLSLGPAESLSWSY